jgi:hypothetical protein
MLLMLQKEVMFSTALLFDKDNAPEETHWPLDLIYEMHWTDWIINTRMDLSEYIVAHLLDDISWGKEQKEISEDIYGICQNFFVHYLTTKHDHLQSPMKNTDTLPPKDETVHNT